MRLRMTLVDSSANLDHDVVVECDPHCRVGAVVGEIARTFGVAGTAHVDGVPVDVEQSLADSPLITGAVVTFAPPASVRRSRFVGRDGGDVPRLRVLSGPSAGAEYPLGPGTTLTIGRSAGNEVVLADPDVSGQHASISNHGGTIEVSDPGSTNGTWVDDRRATSAVAVSDRTRIQVGGSRLTVELPDTGQVDVRRGQPGELLLNRVARNRPAPFDAPTITFPTPPSDDEPRGFPVLTAVLPLVLAVVLVLVLHNLLYLMMGLLTPVMMAGNWWSDRRRRQRRDQRVDARFREELIAARREVEAAVDAEDFTLRTRLPDPAGVIRTALTPRVELWARHPADDDWLHLRLGTADQPASARIGGSTPRGWTAPVVRDAPIAVDLDSCGILGLAGPQTWLDRRLEWVVTQLATHHSPDELHLAVIAPDGPEARSGWMRWLPHVTTSGGDPLVAWDDATAEDLVRSLAATLAATPEGPGGSGPPRPGRQEEQGRLVVVLVGTGDLRRRPSLAGLLVHGPAAGVRFVCAEIDARTLPDGCRTQLVADASGSLLRSDRAETVALRPDEMPAGTVEHIARALAPLRRTGDAPAARIPDAVRLLDLIGAPDAERIRAEWRRSGGETSVVVGVGADGPATVDIAREGPHALIAGTSGAGKSELLQTLIAALAHASPPELLTFLFVDYKGGATFKDLALPHVVGSVTNLDAKLARRALASLDAELVRRQRQLSAHGATDLPDYRRRRDADPALPALPRLVIVVDELAELKQQLVEFVDGLVRVARIGRSLGVHLVLATQRPAGVVDGQIRANVELRICLRVANDAESIDVIDRSDAARIPKRLPGRAYVVGGGEPARLLQAARITTAPREMSAADLRVTPVRWNQLAAPAAETDRSGTATDLDALVSAIGKAAELDGRPAPQQVSVPPLPPVVALDELERRPLALVLGLRDRPELQCREPLTVPLGTGHLAIAGSARSGRTSALRALAVALASTSTPAQLHLHVIEGAGGLASLTGLPHVGVVVGQEDPQRVERLLTCLVAEMRDRKRMLAERGAASIDDLPPGSRPAHVVLVVDGWAGTGGINDGPNPLAELLAGGLAAGVTVVVAGDEQLLRPRLLSRFTYRMCLRLNDPNDAAVIGLDRHHLPVDLPPGRAVWGEDGSEVQVPLLSRDPAGPAQAAALAGWIADAGGPVDAGGPLRLDPLPVRIPIDDAIALGPVPSGVHGLLGVAGDRLAPVWVPLDEGCVAVTGPARTGRSTAAVTVAITAIRTGGAVLLVVEQPDRTAFDPARAAGVEVLGHRDLGGRLDGVRPGVVVVDDADRADLDERTVDLLTGRGSPAVVVAAPLESFGYSATGLLRAGRSPMAVVMLSPTNHLDASNVGLTIARDTAFSGPPGRALFAVHGAVQLGQVALSEPA